MNKPLKRILLTLTVLVLIPLLWIGGNIVYATLTDYQPPEQQQLAVEGADDGQQLTDSTFTFLIWNIGYSGLGAEEDFWFDGGETVRAPKERVEANLKGIYNTLAAYHQQVDFILLQEVDTAARRSWFNNQRQGAAEQLPGYSHSFAPNYMVNYIVMPLTNPMGKVNGGLVSFSQYQPTESVRYQFPGNYGWPKRVYFLDRCFLLQRFSMSNGQQLVVINTHNSAYDDGNLKATQMEYLKELLLEEYNKGNYVVVGGDWNQIPPYFDNNTFAKTPNDTYNQINIAPDYMPRDWTWAYDPTVPTNRKLAEPYDADSTFTTVIDFYLVSPNLQVESVTGHDLDFQYSDHQPVKLTVNIK